MTGGWTSGSTCSRPTPATWCRPRTCRRGPQARSGVHRRRHRPPARPATRLNSRHAHREHPRSRTRRFVSNVRVEETADGQLSVSANLLVYRFRSGEGAPYVGTVEYILRRDGGDFRIAHRRAVLDMEDLSWHGAVSIIGLNASGITGGVNRGSSPATAVNHLPECRSPSTESAAPRSIACLGARRMRTVSPASTTGIVIPSP